MSENADLEVQDEKVSETFTIAKRRKRKRKDPLDGLTRRQAALVQGMANNTSGESIKSLMIKAGYSEKTNQDSIVNGEKIRSALVAALHDRGITTDLIGDVLLDGVTARADHNDITSKPERITRLKYLEKILDILGVKNNEEKSQNSWEAMVQQVNIKL